MVKIRATLALLLVPCIVLGNVRGLARTGIFAASTPMIGSARSIVEGQALAMTGASYPRGGTDNRQTAWSLWKAIAAVSRGLYGTHRAFRTGATFVLAVVGWLTTFHPGLAQRALSLNQGFNHHSVWSLAGLFFVGATTISQADAGISRRVPLAYRQSFLFFAFSLFAMVVVSSGLSQFVLHDSSFYVISCLFRNSVAMLWVFRGFLKLNDYPARSGSWMLKGLFQRNAFAAITGILMLLSGPPALLNLFHRTSTSVGWLLQSRGFWDWIAGLSVWFLWFLWPARKSVRPSGQDTNAPAQSDSVDPVLLFNRTRDFLVFVREQCAALAQSRDFENGYRLLMDKWLAVYQLGNPLLTRENIDQEFSNIRPASIMRMMWVVLLVRIDVLLAPNPDLQEILKDVNRLERVLTIERIEEILTDPQHSELMGLLAWMLGSSASRATMKFPRHLLRPRAA